MGSSTKRSTNIFHYKDWSNVNLGNIPPEDIIEVETIRRGLRGDTIGKVKLE